MTRGRGSGVTPPRIVELLKKEVEEKSILAVSKASGLGLAAIGRYLKGEGEPTTKTLQKLAEYFKVSVPWLRGEIEIPFDEDYNPIGPNRGYIRDEITRQLRKKQDDSKHGKEYLIKEGHAKYPKLWEAFFAIPEEEREDALSLLMRYYNMQKSNMITVMTSILDELDDARRK